MSLQNQMKNRTTALQIERIIMSNFFNRMNLFRKAWCSYLASAWCLYSLNEFLFFRLNLFHSLILLELALERFCNFFIVLNIVYLILTIKIVTVAEVLFKYQDECPKPRDKSLKSKTQLFFYHYLLFSSIPIQALLCWPCDKGSVPNSIPETHSQYITLINYTVFSANLFISFTTSLTYKNLNSCFLAFFAVIGIGIFIGILVTIQLITFSSYYILTYYLTSGLMIPFCITSISIDLRRLRKLRSQLLSLSHQSGKTIHP